MDREEILNQIRLNKEKIKELNKHNYALAQQYVQICDSEGHYTEKEEIHGRGRSRKDLVGRRYWMEDFKDEDTGEVVTIERSQAVKVDGEWTDAIKSLIIVA